MRLRAWQLDHTIAAKELIWVWVSTVASAMSSLSLTKDLDTLGYKVKTVSTESFHCSTCCPNDKENSQQDGHRDTAHLVYTRLVITEAVSG